MRIAFFLKIRTAVFRRTASDLQSAGSKHKILDRFKQARMYFPKLFLIVEKDRVKKGKLWKDRF